MITFPFLESFVFWRFLDSFSSNVKWRKGYLCINNRIRGELFENIVSSNWENMEISSRDPHQAIAPRKSIHCLRSFTAFRDLHLMLR